MENLRGAGDGRTSLLSTVGARSWGAVQPGTGRAGRSTELLEHIWLNDNGGGPESIQVAVEVSCVVREILKVWDKPSLNSC